MRLCRDVSLLSLPRAALVRGVVVAAVAIAAACASTHEANWSAGPMAPVASADALAVQTALTAEGDAAWAGRATQAQLQLAIAKWEQAAAKAPTLALAEKLARAHYFLGDGFYALTDDAQNRDLEYQRGLDWSTQALKMAAPEFAAAMAAGKKHSEAIMLAPKDAVPAMYWYASNLGKWAVAKGFTTVLRYKDDIKATMEHIKALDEMYFYAGPWRYFGAFEARTAGIAGGSLDKSKENFQKATTLAPAYLGTRVLWAEFLCTKQQDRATYKKLLDEVIAADANVDPAIAPENNVEQQKARRLLAAIDENF